MDFSFINDIDIPITCLLFLSVITYVFLRTHRIGAEENSVYKFLLFSCTLSIIVDIVSISLLHIYPDDSLIKTIFAKLYLCSHLFFLVGLTYYLNIFSWETNKYTPEETLRRKRNIVKIAVIFTIVQSIIVFLLPINFYIEGSAYYYKGAAVQFAFCLNVLYALAWVTRIITHFKYVPFNKLASLVSYMFIAFFCYIIEMMVPDLLISTIPITFGIFIIYFSMDNPDIELMEELAFTKRQIENATSAKDDFLSNMSHEIRTPLNAILGFSQILSEADTDKETKENINEIEYASTVLMDIVNGILDISKMESGKFNLYESDYAINDIIKDVEQRIKKRIRDKEIELVTIIDPDLPKAFYGDPSQVEQVMMQLLSNAVKFTEKGKITLTIDYEVKGKDSFITIAVEDTGIGIKEEDLDRIFRKFEKLETSKALKIEGAGLGLAITRNLVEMMNGSVMVQSIYGKGSKFTVSIKQKVSNAKIEIKKDTPTITDFGKKRILLVDDNPMNIKVAKRLLEQYNCVVESVLSGIECLNKINSNAIFDLIFMDDMMPGLSGAETLKKLKSINSFKTRVVILTANSNNGVKEQYLKQGFDDYLAKPISKDELCKVLNRNLVNRDEG